MAWRTRSRLTVAALPDRADWDSADLLRASGAGCCAAGAASAPCLPAPGLTALRSTHSCACLWCCTAWPAGCRQPCSSACSSVRSMGRRLAAVSIMLGRGCNSHLILHLPCTEVVHCPATTQAAGPHLQYSDVEGSVMVSASAVKLRMGSRGAAPGEEVRQKVAILRCRRLGWCGCSF